jgi:ketosteroid isomerase-like protein
LARDFHGFTPITQRWLLSRFLLIVILIVGLAGPAVFAQSRRTPPAAPSLPNPAGEKGLVELERQILEAIRERNTEKLDAILAPDFVYVSPRKRDLRRQEFLNQVKSSPQEIEWLGAEELKIHIYGEIAVITGVQNAKVRSEKTGLQSADSAFTDVFRRRQGRWELVLAFRADMPALPAKK